MNASHLDLQLTRHYLGSAKVRLDQLQYDPGTDPSARLADPHRREANVARLLDIFQNEGWRPLDPKNHISAVVPRSRLPLSAPLARSPYGPDFPDVDLETVPYVDGRDRVAAARFFPVDKQWWIVDFYDSRITESAKDYLRQYHPNTDNYTDGETFQIIHHYTVHHELDPDGALRQIWKDRLSGNKLKCLRAIERTPWAWRILGNLCQYPGLVELELGKWPTIFGLKCDEELEGYLQTVEAIWRDITLGEADVAMCVDHFTVHALQGLIPGFSEDRAKVDQAMGDPRCFPGIGGSKRAAIKRRIHARHDMLLTVHTFEEDVKYIGETMSGVARFLPVPSRGTWTVRQRAARALRHEGTAQLQHSNGRFSTISISPDEPDLAFASAYVQLMLVGFRWLLTPKRSKAPSNSPASSAKRTERLSFDVADASNWLHFVEEAQALGFSPRPGIPPAGEADRARIEASLRSRFPSERYLVDEEALAQEIDRQRAQEQRIFTLRPPQASSLFCPPSITSAAARCGRPDDTVLARERDFLFLEPLAEPQPLSSPPTLERIRINVIQAFFGQLWVNAARACNHQRDVGETALGGRETGKHRRILMTRRGPAQTADSTALVRLDAGGDTVMEDATLALAAPHPRDQETRLQQAQWDLQGRTGQYSIIKKDRNRDRIFVEAGTIEEALSFAQEHYDARVHSIGYGSEAHTFVIPEGLQLRELFEKGQGVYQRNVFIFPKSSTTTHLKLLLL